MCKLNIRMLTWVSINEISSVFPSSDQCSINVIRASYALPCSAWKYVIELQKHPISYYKSTIEVITQYPDSFILTIGSIYM